MPWHIEERDNQYCVIKDDDNSVEGCHESRGDAATQMAALYASEQESVGGPTLKRQIKTHSLHAIEAEQLTGNQWEVVIIGQDPTNPNSLQQLNGREFIASHNGLLYDTQALEQAAAKFEGARVYDNHLTDQEFAERGRMRSPGKDWVGNLVNVVWDQASKALKGVFKVVDNNLSSKLMNALNQGLSLPGLSIDVFYEQESINGMLAAVGIADVTSVDVVMDPAAGGRLIRAIASRQSEDTNMAEENETVELSDELEEKLKGWVDTAFGDYLARQEQEQAEIEEEEEDSAESDNVETEDSAESETAEDDPVAALENRITLLEQQTRAAEQAQLVAYRNQRIAEAKLSAEFANIITATYPDDGDYTTADIDAAVERVKEAYMSRDGSGRPNGAGGSRITEMWDQADKMEAAFLRGVFGTREFRALESNEDNEVKNRLPEGYKMWVKRGRPEFGPFRLSQWVYDMAGGDNPLYSERAMEAVTTSNMSSIVKNTLNLKLAAEYSRRHQWWDSVALTEELDTIDPATLVRTYGLSTLPDVNEGAAYLPEDWTDDEETASFIKKGKVVEVTLETLLKDKTNSIRRIPSLLSNAWYNTVSNLVATVFTTNTAAGPVLSDTGALFNATAVTTAGGHANLLTTALGTTNAAYAAARLAMRKQTDQALGAGSRLMIIPRYLLVPVDLEGAAKQIKLTEESREASDPGPYSGEFDVVVVPEWTDANDWAIVADPMLWPAIYLFFLRGNRTPSLFGSDSETAGSMFTNDTMRWKVRMMTWQFSTTYTCAPVADFRPLHKNNVA